MGKLQFFEMRAEEMATMYSQDFTKKQAIETGVKLVSDLIENGTVDKRQFMANLCRLKEVVNAADSEMRKHLPAEKIKIYGVEFTPVEGGNTVNYSDDEVYQDLKSQIAHRESLLKVALNSNIEIYDENGVLVPKVSTTPRKSSITIKF